MKTSLILTVLSIIIIAVFAVDWREDNHGPAAQISAAETEYHNRNSRQDGTATGSANETRPITDPATVNAHRHSNAIDEFDRLVAARQFSKAVDLYQDVYQRFDESVSRRLRTSLLQQSAELARLDPELAAQLLTSYVQLFYRDVDALMRLAKILEQQQDYPQSLLRLQEAHAAAHTQADLEHIQSRIDRVTGDFTQRLTTSKDYDGLVSLYRTLIERQPNHAPYYLALARAHIAAGRPKAALTALRYIEYHSELGSQAREMIANLDVAGEAPGPNTRFSTVPLIPVGRHFVVNAHVNGMPVKLMLDTGASITVIKSELARAAGIPVDHTHIITLTTANGQTKAPTAQLNQMLLGDQSVSRLDVVVLDLEELTGVDGLLGMDFLGRYRFTIDRERNILLLSE